MSKYRTLIYTFLFFTFLFFQSIHPAQAQELTTTTPTGTPSFSEIASDEFYRAKILTIKEEVRHEETVASVYTIEAQITRGLEKDAVVTITHYDSTGSFEKRNMGVGDTVVLTKTYDYTGTPLYYLMDVYRVPALYFISGVFFFLAVWFGRKKGITSILGLALSFVILIKFVVAKILDGSDPLLISLIGATIIAVVSIYLAHGLQKRTTVAVISTLITLWLSAGLAWIFVSLTRLTGFGTEEAFLIATGPLSHIDLRGLLLAAIIIGALGVLDDITTAQAATIDEIKKANPAVSFVQLYKHGLSVGQEHISSLINTLVLAYAGASFPLLLLFQYSHLQPAWVVVNSEFMAEEIVRTLVGSSALILAVPITTLLATYTFSKRKSPD